MFGWFSLYFTIPPGTCKEAEAYRAGATIITKLNDLNAEKTQPSGDLNRKQRTV